MHIESVLIVEDERILALDLELMLSRAGLEILGIAVDGTQAEKLVQSHKPDLILMDITLRYGQDGIELARHLHNFYQIPVIFITGNSDHATKARAMTVQPLAYLQKPISEFSLTTIISGLNQQQPEN